MFVVGSSLANRLFVCGCTGMPCWDCGGYFGSDVWDDKTIFNWNGGWCLCNRCIRERRMHSTIDLLRGEWYRTSMVFDTLWEQTKRLRDKKDANKTLWEETQDVEGEVDEYQPRIESKPETHDILVFVSFHSNFVETGTKGSSFCPNFHCRCCCGFGI